MLESIRRLEAARDRGELTPDEFERAKERLFETVEDAVTVTSQPSQTAPHDAPSTTPPGTDIFWPALISSVLAVGIVTGLATLLFGDLTLALTLAVTLLAAIMVKAFRTLDE